MTKRPLILAALAALPLLSGCGTDNRGIESVHQPVVTRSDYVLDVAATPAGLADSEASRLAGWLDAIHLTYGDSVAVDDPNGGNRATRAGIGAVVGRYGLLLAGAAPVTAGDVAPGTVRVVVSRAHAAVPGCSDFSRMNGPNFNAHTSSNYGCATNTNLAAMIANPSDLVRGAPGTTDYDTQIGMRAISTMRRASPTGDGGTSLRGKSEGVSK